MGAPRAQPRPAALAVEAETGVEIFRILSDAEYAELSKTAKRRY